MALGAVGVADVAGHFVPKGYERRLEQSERAGQPGDRRTGKG
jgi:hypothetical protein